jgi:hypothetical protein
LDQRARGGGFVMDKPSEVVSLEFIRTYLIKPLAEQFERFEREMRDQLVGMRGDFREALEDNRATLRTITDAETGYIPRGEHQLFQTKIELAIKESNARIDSLFRWLVTTAIAAIGLALEVANLATHHN